MGFPVHTYPAHEFVAIETSLRKGGFTVHKIDDRKVRVVDGLARVEVVDFTEAVDSTVHFIVLFARGPLGILLIWFLDGRLSAKVWKHLTADGARLVDLRKEEMADPATPDQRP